MKLKAYDACRIAKNAFGKFVHSVEILKTKITAFLC
jgi:hypothetical protein